jgi:hypothetical protein
MKCEVLVVVKLFMFVFWVVALCRHVIPVFQRNMLSSSSRLKLLVKLETACRQNAVGHFCDRRKQKKKL